MRSIALLTILCTAVTAGCAAHHHARPVKVLEAEHSNRAIVVVRARPAGHRHCWTHGAHWHCRKH